MPISDELRSQIVAQIMQSALPSQQRPDYAELMLKQQAQAEENQYRQDALGLQRQGIEATTGQTAEERKSRDRQATEDRLSSERLAELVHNIQSRQVAVQENPPEQRPPPSPLPGTPESEEVEWAKAKRKQEEEDRQAAHKNIELMAKRIAADVTTEAQPNAFGDIAETIKHPFTRRGDWTHLRRRYARNVMDELEPILKDGKVPESVILPIIKTMMRAKYPSLTDEEFRNVGL